MRRCLALIVYLVCMQVLASASGAESFKLYTGYVTKISCRGKLLISAIGNDQLVKLDAYPKELGCGVLLKPIAHKGATNFLLETSTESVSANIQIVTGVPKPRQLELNLSSFEQGTETDVESEVEQ